MSQPRNPWPKRVRRLFVVFGAASTFYLVLSYAMDRMREARMKALKEKKDRDLAVSGVRRGSDESDAAVSEYIEREHTRELIAAHSRARKSNPGGHVRRRELGVRVSEASAAAHRYQMTSSTMSHSISLPPTEDSSSPSPPSDTSQLHPSPPPSDNLQVPGMHIEQKSKKELWRELKIQSITRTLTTIYLLPILYLLTSSQLSILARTRYLDDVKAALPVPTNTSVNGRQKTGWLASFSVDSLGLSEFVERSTPGFLPNPINLLTSLFSSTPDEVEERNEEDEAEAEKLFLTYSWWFLHQGWRGIATRVESAVENVFGSMPLKKELTTQQWSNLIQQVCKEVEMVSEERTQRPFDFTPHIIPPSPLPPTSVTAPLPMSPADHSKHLVSLLDQTSVHLSSPDGKYLLHKGVDVMIGKLIESLKMECYITPDGELQTKRLVDCLPEITRWGRGVWEGIPDGGVEVLLNQQEFENFAALIFADWAPL
ncbi:peroxin-3, partial [Tremellales sp. Uapishka_1]